ncbi:MAG: hypothetical protein JOY98_10620 [Candidatus Eremiobacteraeota bacterium]|nr:hypothetical protein [Candidatus Eremiobacteraeota bacterium]
MIRTRTLRAFAAAALPAVALALAACGHKSAVTTESAGGTAPQAGTIVAGKGTVFYGKLDKAVGTKISHDGDTFTLTESDTLFHKTPALAGAIVDGHVENVHAAGPMRNPSMTIVFDDLRLPDGTKEPVSLTIVSTKEFDPKTHHLRTIGLMLGGAVAGHIAAKHAGARHGGMMGALGGYALSQTLKTDVEVPAGSLVELRLNAPVTKSS